MALFCTECGNELKENARFCHNCGAPVKGQNGGSAKKAGTSKVDLPQQSWLSKYGAYLFIPVFVLIVVLLFWKNQEPASLNTPTATSTSQNQAMSASMEKVHKMLDRLKKAVEDDPKNVAAMDSLGNMFYIAGSFAKARDYFEMHLAVEPDNNQTKILLARTYFNLKNKDKAIEILQGILDKEPDFVFALSDLADIYDSMHEHDKAKEYWQKIIADYPGTQFASDAQKRLSEQKAGE